MRHLLATTALGLVMAAAPVMAQDNQNKMQNQDATQGQTQELIQESPNTQSTPGRSADQSAQTGQSGSSGETAGQDQPDTTAGSPSPTDKSTQSTAQDEQKPGAEGATGTAQAPADQTGQPEQETAGMDKTRASELIGTSVQNAQGENVGEINDILLAEDGSASQVLIGVGGFLGLGEKNVAVDFSELNFGAEGEVTIAMSAEALEQQPAYKEEESPAGTSAQPEQNENTPGNAPEGDTNQPNQTQQ